MQKKDKQIGELPKRFELWKQWNLLAWGGELPGRKAILAANTQRRTMARTVDDIPQPATAHLMVKGKDIGGLC